MKIEITKRFIWNGKWIEIGEVFQKCSGIPEGCYKEIKEPVKVEKSKKDKKGFNEYD